MTITRLTINTGILFPSTVTKSFVSKVNLELSVATRDEGNLYAAIWVSLEKVETKIIIEYPKLPAVLA